MGKNSRHKNHKNLDFGIPIFQEKLRWSWWLWCFAIFMAASLALAIWAALGITGALISFVIQIILLAIAERKSSLQITLTKGWLLVGPATIERAFLHNFLALDFKEFKRIRGVDADPASYLQIRFWVSSAIKIDLRDPKDRTPYWLISTNRANELAKLLNVADH